MIDHFEIIAHDSPRPEAERIIFCDGTGGALFRPESDLELSHWRPNKTPTEYRAGTSTEICFRFLDNPRPGPWTVAVNNHVDVDGILSVYVLVHSPHALAHRQTIIDAAEMGDFWGWGDAPAQRVFQGVTRLMNSGEGKAVYAEAFRRIPALIDGTDPEIPQIDASLSPLRRGVELVEQGRIVRSLLGNRLAHYIVPLAVAGDDDDRASYAPEFNEAISERAILWPQVRARWDAERACLVSVERRTGWFHDLWFPGYFGPIPRGCGECPASPTTTAWGATISPTRSRSPPSRSCNGRRPHPDSGASAERSCRLAMNSRIGSRWSDDFLTEGGKSAASQLSPERVAAAFEGVFA